MSKLAKWRIQRGGGERGERGAPGEGARGGGGEKKKTKQPAPGSLARSLASRRATKA